MSFLLKLEHYSAQVGENLPRGSRHIPLQYDESSVIVYSTVRGGILRSFHKGDGSEIKYYHSIDADDTAGNEAENRVEAVEETDDTTSSCKLGTTTIGHEKDTHLATSVEEKELSLARYGTEENQTCVTAELENQNNTTKNCKTETSMIEKCEIRTRMKVKCETQNILSAQSGNQERVECENQTHMPSRAKHQTYLARKCNHESSGTSINERDTDKALAAWNTVNDCLGKTETESCANEEEKNLDNLDCVWIETSFVRILNAFEEGGALKNERIIAVSITKVGFEEILQAHVSDIQNDKEPDEVVVEWRPDVNPFGDFLERFVPSLGIKGNMLQQFYRDWVLGIKDITGYVKHQRSVIQNGKFNFLRTPTERVYTPDDMNFGIVLGLNRTDENNMDSGGWNGSVGIEPFTLAEAFANVQNSETNISASQPREAILYLYGSFNPVHQGHVKALTESKQWLENVAKYIVCDTRIAIASDNNIREKFSASNDLCIKFEHRVKLCELACVHHTWIKVSQTPVRCQPKYGEELRKELNKPRATLVLLMGSDRALLTNTRVKAASKENRFILCIGRKGMDNSARKAFEEAKKNDPSRSLQFFVVPTELNDISSTSIRQKMRLMNNKRVKEEQRNAIDLRIVREMIQYKWITEEVGEYIFHNCSSLYISK